MKTRISKVISRYVLFLIPMLISFCDTLGPEGIHPTLAQTDYYTLPGSSIIVDLTSLAKKSFTNISLSISENPTKGALSQVDELLLKYKPGLEFIEGEDQFVLTMKSDGKIISTQQVKIHMKGSKEEFPCALIAVEDKVKATPGTSVSIPILDNDWFCGTNSSNVSISIYTNPQFGEVSVNGESIVYQPGSSFKGVDEVIYKLTRSSGEDDAYGLITFSDWTTQIFDVPLGARTMFFVDERTGYVGGNGLYKTTDSGENWNQIFDSKDIQYRSFTDIHFLDKENGFAAYTCVGYDAPCLAGLMQTNDGGDSWQEVNLSDYGLPWFVTNPLSIFFTSLTTGFVGGIVSDGWDGPQVAIIQTTNGGSNWSPITSSQFGPLETSIKLTDTNTGYILLSNQIFTTNDGGESWNQSLSSNQKISSIDVVPGSVICASLTNASTVTPNSSIVRTTNGSNWNEVANFSYEITNLGFSPSGDIGLAIGANSSNRLSSDPTKILFINISTDKGETWTTEYFEDFLNASLLSSPNALVVPSDNVFYILYDNKILKYTNY